MGASYSLHSKFTAEMNVKEEPLEFTPSRRLCDLRVLALDPRSPSEFFDRTPIIVNKTPDLQDNKGTSHPVRVNSDTFPVIKDPRSPTAEFTRTPINPCYPSPAVATRHSVAVMPTDDHHSLEQDICEPESDFESSSVSTTLADVRLPGSLAASLIRSQESSVCSVRDCQIFSEKDQDTSLHDTELSPDVLDASSLDMDVMKDIDDGGCDGLGISTSDVLENKSLTKVKSTEESTPKLPVVVRPVSRTRIGMKPKMLSLTPGVTRSPLSAVNNSPRVLSQRNIMPSHGGKPTQALSLFIDKENIHH